LVIDSFFSAGKTTTPEATEMLRARYWADYSGIPRDASLLVYASSFTFIGIGVIWGTLQAFLYLEGLSFAVSGLIVTVWGITAASATLLFGGLADRYGRKRMIITGGFLSSLSIILFGLVREVSLLYVVAVCTGLSEAMFAASWSAFLADKAGDVKRTSVFSLSFLVSTISQAIGGFSLSLLYLLRGMYGFELIAGTRYLFVAAGLLGLVGPVLISRVSDQRVPNGSPAFRVLPRTSRGVVAKYSLAGIIVALGAGMVIPLMPGWALLKFKLTYDVTAPFLVGLNSIAMGIANLLVPGLARRFGTVRTIVMTEGFSTVFLFSIPFLPSFGLVWPVFLVRSMLMMMSNPAQNSLLMGLVPPEERSTASAIATSLWRFPNSFSTVVGAYLMGLGLLSAPFFICTGLYVTAIAYFWIAFRKVVLPEERQQQGASEPVGLMIPSAVPADAAEAA